MFAGTFACVLALTAGTASAHYCYNEKRSEKGNEQVAANSNGYMTFSQMLVEWGMCQEGIDHVVENTPESIPLDVPIHAHATMGGGAVHNGKDPGGIGHIDASDEDWDAFDAAIGEAAGMCGVQAE